MKVEHLDRLCLGVPDLEEAKETFGKLLGLTFEFSGRNQMPDGSEVNLAISNQGIELLEVPGRPIHLRSFHFKVNGIEEAARHLKEQGVEVISEFALGDMDEKVLDLFGLRAILIDYPGEDPAKAAAGIVRASVSEEADT